MPKRKRKKEDGTKKDVKYKGVGKRGERYLAYIKIDGKNQYPGTFDTPKEAAQAYDRAAIQAGRPTSKLNFLDQVPKNYKPKKKKLSSGNTTGFRGVVKKGNRFKAQIYIGGKKQYIGMFGTAKEAAEAYDQSSLQAKFPISYLNFPHSMEHDKKEAGEEVVVEEEEEEGKDEEEEENEEENEDEEEDAEVPTPSKKMKTHHSSSSISTKNYKGLYQDGNKLILCDD